MAATACGWAWLLVVGIALPLGVDSLVADTLTKTDGTVYKGRVVEEKDGYVFFEIRRNGGRGILPIPRTKIRSIVPGKDEQPAPASKPTTRSVVPLGPGYYPLPIKGVIGVDIRAEFLRQAMADARKAKPDYVVLYFDSPGGSVREMVKLLDVLAESKKSLRIIALVRQASSAASVLAMACSDIYMKPEGTIGAPPPGAKAEGLTPMARLIIHERMAIAARIGGHNPLIGRGMVEPDLELALLTVDGKPAVQKGRGGLRIKTPGKLLSLKATPAVNCGLAKGVCDSIAALHKPLGLKAWHVAPGKGWAMMVRLAAESRRKRAGEKRSKVHTAYMTGIAGKLKELDDELAQIKKQGQEAEESKRQLARDYDKKRQAMRDDRDRERREAERHRSSNPSLASDLRRAATERYNERRKQQRLRHQPQVDRIDREIRKLFRDMKRLKAKRQKLLAAAPKG
ncbi:hypothetical protein LCGC14_1734710 [marine sediment metagenome]|uniref:NfeD1b N-terminal domain-containing protein n=1 Tax=marine sediment metagenome TaxID=412755 RepID=A0A0F9JNY0_9ZZZZ